MTHRWSEGIRNDLNTTLRHCQKCPLIKVSRHEPENDPPHWTEWELHGRRFVQAKTPECVPA